ncbi:YqgE/AlgH family protein [Frigidibacter sp. RF13]|uniref:YqgE/AlgH family protein n=1 Tax=Frigidibacter sp. RF13 TaxID=2997340 RepID=UPI0022711334|nr:YqgE/AlgH family protein [Frigidibacter sp. RF13]MCY1127717.1 YqgE/AlgH family protein [Frigidibacter sp. RF13]
MDLTGKLLIAMPGMGDPRFEHSVVFLCVHTHEAAMGLIVNKPARDLRFDALLNQLGIPRSDRSRDIRVHFGGPVEHARGFVLHSGDYEGEGSTLRVDGRFGMTATLDILQALAEGDGPERSMLALGYAGWGPGQLEGEIRDNGWLTCDAEEELIFGLPDARKWTSALRSIGVDPLSLSSTAGNA